jgi:hypothetical protein
MPDLLHGVGRNRTGDTRIFNFEKNDLKWFNMALLAWSTIGKALR